METKVHKFTFSLVSFACIAIILFCLTGISAIVGWIPSPANHSYIVMVSSNLDKPQNNVCLSNCADGKTLGLYDDNLKDLFENDEVVKASVNKKTIIQM